MGMRSTKLAVTLVPLIFLGRVAAAEVVSSTPAGFTVSDTVTINAPAKRVYTALSQIGSWWSSKHTGTGNAANMYLDLSIKGCFCERGPDGQQRVHMTVVDVEPNQLVRLRGALGPLQGEGVDGALTWAIKPADGGVSLSQTYSVGGYYNGGLDKIAPGVDGVLHQQLARLKAFVETGSPEIATK